MPVKIKVKVSPQFKILYQLPPDINLIIAIGSRGGMKTYEVSKFGTYCATMRKKRVAVLRDEKETIRESILNDILTHYDKANKYGHFDDLYEKLDNGIKSKLTGEMLVFTKGFRASSNEKKTNLKGVSEVDIAIVEEAEDIRSFEKFSTFKDSIRTQGRLIIIILNTPDIQHWIVQRYFNLELIEDGYWKLIPKKIKGFLAIQTTYKDNPYLPMDVVRDYEGYGDPQSELYDPHYHKTAILGLASSGRKGQVLTKVKSITNEEYMKLPYKEIYGQDFGTASPAGLIGVKIHGNNCWAREINYRPKPVMEIGKLYCQLGFGDEDLIIGDCAEPNTISQLRIGWKEEELNDELLEAYPGLVEGFYIKPCLKWPGAITAGISKMNSMNLYLTEESKNGWKEVYNYVYAVDKNDNFTSEPADEYNHLIDPWRYVIQGRGRLY